MISQTYLTSGFLWRRTPLINTIPVETLGTGSPLRQSIDTESKVFTLIVIVEENRLLWIILFVKLTIFYKLLRNNKH